MLSKISFYDNILNPYFYCSLFNWLDIQNIFSPDNDRPPNTTELWKATQNGETNVTYSCAMRPGESCVKYIYYYNKGGKRWHSNCYYYHELLLMTQFFSYTVQNITYMCAKVNATSGCYQQKFISGAEVEVCVCKSQQRQMPCNGCQRLMSKTNSLMLIVMAIAGLMMQPIMQRFSGIGWKM